MEWFAAVRRGKMCHSWTETWVYFKTRMAAIWYADWLNSQPRANLTGLAVYSFDRETETLEGVKYYF
jgi:hypothetical protein